MSKYSYVFQHFFDIKIWCWFAVEFIEITHRVVKTNKQKEQKNKTRNLSVVVILSLKTWDSSGPVPMNRHFAGHLAVIRDTHLVHRYTSVISSHLVHLFHLLFECCKDTWLRLHILLVMNVLCTAGVKIKVPQINNFFFLNDPSKKQIIILG